jgi:glutathione S-transferase
VLSTMLAIPADNQIVKVLGARGAKAFRLVEERLGQAQYFAGEELTAADIMMFFPLTTMRTFAKRDISSYPNIGAYLTRVGARPAYQRAMAKGDPDMKPLLA